MIISISPITAHVRNFFDCSSFSDSAPPITMSNAAKATAIVATGAAKYSNPPAIICKSMIVPFSAPCVPILPNG